MKHETPAGSLQEVPRAPSVRNAMFRSEGDFWRVGYKSQACLLKDAKVGKRSSTAWRAAGPSRCRSALPRIPWALAS